MIYSGYMTFLSFRSTGEPILSENLIKEKNSLLIKDVFFKYLISFGVALFLMRITLFIDWIPINYYFSSRYGWVQNYVFVILPILLLFDAKYFDHLRCPTFKDMIILLCILGIHVVYYIILVLIQLQPVEILWRKIVTQDLNLFIYSFIGYLIYDCILFRKTSTDNYFFKV